MSGAELVRDLRRAIAAMVSDDSAEVSFIVLTGATLLDRSQRLRESLRDDIGAANILDLVAGLSGDYSVHREDWRLRQVGARVGT